jgi:hypothetical protein
MEQLASGNAWNYTVGLLDRVSSPGYEASVDTRQSRPKSRPAARPAPAAKVGEPSASRIEIVERWSRTVIVVDWTDPTSGHYGEQPWAQVTARRRGVCALSGAEIRRGDLIYRPSARGRAPANADWVMLASAIRELESESAIPDLSEIGLPGRRRRSRSRCRPAS